MLEPDDAMTRPPILPNQRLYPDVAAAGSLANALTEAAEEQGFSLRIQQSESDSTQLLSATILTDRGRIAIDTGAEERWFIPMIWWRGVQLTSGRTPNLADVIAVAQAWIDRVSLIELHEHWPFMSCSELAQAHERGPAAAVDVEWLRLLQRAERDDHLILRPLVRAAAAEPRLRQLFPFTSHWALLFSTCTGFPYSRDIPLVEPLQNNRYRVIAADRKTTIGEVDGAETAIRMIVEELPTNCGPAVAGTADDQAQGA